MQRLKSVLNAALAKQALRIRMAAGEAPEWLTENQAVEKDPAGPISEDEIKGILAVVLPGHKVFELGDAVGALNIGAQGVLKIRAQTTPSLSISFYTQRGSGLFESDSTQVPAPMTSTTPAPASSVPPISSVPPAPPVSGGKISFSPDPALASAQAIPPPPLPGFGVATAAMPPEAEAPRSIAPPPPPSPLAMSVAPVPPVPSVSAPIEPPAAPRVAVAAEPAPVAPKSEPVMPLTTDKAQAVKESADPSSMFRVSATPKKSVTKKVESADQPQAAAPAMVQSMPSALVQPVPAPVMMAAPIVTSAVVEEPKEINFGNAEASEGSLSDGQNPIDTLLQEMVKLKASDMHLTIGQPVIFRVSGDITRMSEEFISPEMMQRFLMPTLPPRNRAEFSKINDTDYAYELRGVGRFRVNVFRDRNGVGAVMRHIPSQILTAEQLNLPQAITKLCTLNKGLVLVTGPTGSGKSTTLAAMLDLINKTRKEHILTIEDPIEFVHPQQKCLVNQREVHKHTGSFARALKAALREDPDIVLIGEMRDLETIAIAIETAETGHLVFGTLHTTTAMSTVDRIIDQFPADRQAQIRTMLASSLRGVVAQTLLKKKGGGRVAAHEILISNDAVSAMIREGKIQHLANHMMTQKAEGNQLLNDALLKLVQDGVVDPQDAFFKAVDKNSFVASAKQRGITIKLNEAG